MFKHLIFNLLCFSQNTLTGGLASFIYSMIKYSLNFTDTFIVQIDKLLLNFSCILMTFRSKKMRSDV